MLNQRRVVIDFVSPQINSGDFFIKRVVGEVVNVNAHVLVDGHDVVAASVLYKHEKEKKWKEVRMYHSGNDEWHASFVVERLRFDAFAPIAEPSGRVARRRSGASFPFLLDAFAQQSAILQLHFLLRHNSNLKLVPEVVLACIEQAIAVAARVCWRYCASPSLPVLAFGGSGSSCERAIALES